MSSGDKFENKIVWKEQRPYLMWRADAVREKVKKKQNLGNGKIESNENVQVVESSWIYEYSKYIEFYKLLKPDVANVAQAYT